jgi:hypothetical protein
MNGFDAAQAAAVLSGMARGAMALIFAESARHALRNPVAHASIVAAYRLLPAWAVTPTAWGLPVLAAVAATLLIPPATAQAGALLGTGLMLLFALAIGINLHKGRVHIDCGCGGSTVQRISAGLVARNMVLAAILATTAALPTRAPAEAPQIAIIALGAAAFATLHFTASQLLANRTQFRAAGFSA